MLIIKNKLDKLLIINSMPHSYYKTQLIGYKTSHTSKHIMIIKYRKSALYLRSGYFQTAYLIR